MLMFTDEESLGQFLLDEAEWTLAREVSKGKISANPFGLLVVLLT